MRCSLLRHSASLWTATAAFAAAATFAAGASAATAAAVADGGPDPADHVAPPMVSIGDMILGSGFLGLLSLLMPTLAVLLALALFLKLRMGALAPMRLQRSLEHAVFSGDLDAAVAESARADCLLGAVAHAGLRMRRLGLDEMLANIEREAGKQALRIGNRLAHLPRFGGASILLASLGTVLGYIMIFRIAATDPGPVRADDYALGLFPLALGITGAIVCYAAFWWFDHRLTLRTLKVREMAEELAYAAAERSDAARPSGEA